MLSNSTVQYVAIRCAGPVFYVPCGNSELAIRVRYGDASRSISHQAMRRLRPLPKGRRINHVMRNQLGKLRRQYDQM